MEGTMKDSHLGAKAHLPAHRQLNCRIGRTIAIPQPIGDNPLAQMDMLDDIPPVHFLVEAFEREFGRAKQVPETGRVLDFDRK
jgi:hypothetical protein